MKYFFITLIFYIACSTAACTAWTHRDLATQEDYRPIQDTLISENPVSRAAEKALDSFHDKEEEGFVTSLEKAWLKLLSGQAEPELLRPFSDDLFRKKTTVVSKELKRYFYKAAADGYEPSEHEVILLHLIEGLSYAQLGDRRSARVAAQRASFYLESDWKDGASFDDPHLRLWSAALWLYLGDWQHARVDLRKASQLDPKYSWASDLAAKKSPPSEFHVFGAGAGPHVRWKPSVKSVQDWAGLEFYFEGEKPPLPELRNASDPARLNWTDNSRWYEHHQRRHKALRSVLDQSKIALEAASGGAGASVVAILGKTAAVTVATIGGVTGVWLIYIGIVNGGGDIVIYLSAATFYLTGEATSYIWNETDTQVKRMMRQALSPERTYRFVRFMPSYHTFWFKEKKEGLLQPHNQVDQAPSTFSLKGEKFEPFLDLSSPEGQMRVVFYQSFRSYPIIILSRGAQMEEITRKSFKKSAGVFNIR